MRRSSLLVAVTLAFAAGAFSACSGERPSLAEAAATSDAPPGEAGKVATLDARGVDVAVVATAVVPQVAVYDAPDANEPSRTLANPLPAGGPLVLLIDRSIDGWHQVLFPTAAPSGVTGWVRAADVTVARHNYRIDVRLSEFRLDVYLQGQIVRQVKIGLGDSATPQPGTRYYTTELIQPGTPDTVYGSLAYGVSGWSEDGDSFTGEPGQLGIHGTENPTDIGHRVIAGSIAMGNEDIEDLATFLPLGVPVTVES